MSGKIGFVVVIAAFCAGALSDRVYNAWEASQNDIPMAAYVPPPANVAAPEITAPTGRLTMQNCMASANRRGMNREQAAYACDEIIN